MSNYRVRWEIDIDAESAKEAALLALKVQRKEDSIATVFEVESEDGTKIMIDTDPEFSPKPS